MDTLAASASSGDAHVIELAKTTWLHGKVKQARPAIIKSDLWDHLVKQDFAPTDVRLLEQLQCLEKYLWPTYDDDASHHHVLLIVLLLNNKRLANLPTWPLFADRPSDFSSLFRRILYLSLDSTFSTEVSTEVLICIIGAFQSLDNGLIRKECAPLVSIGIWHHIHDEAARKSILEEKPQFKKAWRLWTKRYEAADEPAQVRLRYERSWLYTLISNFISRLYDPTPQDEDNFRYCGRLMELLSDLLSQFPTRRYVNTLLTDLNLLTIIKLSPVHRADESGSMSDFLQLLRHYTDFPIDDHSGRQLTRTEVNELHRKQIAHLQRVCLKSFSDKLGLLALASYGSSGQRHELQTHFEALSDAELVDLARSLGYRTQYSDMSSLKFDRRFVLEVLLSKLEKRDPFQETIKNMPLLPTEKILYDPAFLRTEKYDGARGLAMPKLNLQYLTSADFLWRSFILSRCEAFYEIRSHLEETIKRMHPRRSRDDGSSRPVGTRMGLSISKPAIVEVVAPKVGEAVPAEVKAEITLDVSRLADSARREWEDLRPEEVVFLLNSKQHNNIQALTNGHASNAPLDETPFGVVRAAEIIHVLDENGRPLRYAATNANGQQRRPRERRLLLRLDAAAYAQDIKATAKGKPDVYESVNVIIRRSSRENNFKAVLESIRTLALSDVPLPMWLQDVFLGMGDPAGASYKNLPSALKALDFRDTFVDWQHLHDSLPDMRIDSAQGNADPSNPLYVLEAADPNAEDSQPSAAKRRKNSTSAQAESVEQGPSEIQSKGKQSKQGKASKKRQREEEVEEPKKSGAVRVSTYKPPNKGPYPIDLPRMNKVRFTPAQVEAVKSGTQPGLTVIVGPPGTGKTDVATQIINNIYHNFPKERILLVAHSNQALNQLFQKIIALDIDQRHLLRLGQGERDLQLDTEASYGKQGRVEYFLERGTARLSEVNRLAATIQAPGAHGNSCETADYFNAIYIRPMWKAYMDKVAESESVNEIIQAFPFHDFFADAPQPLFPDNLTKEQALDITTGCYRHIDNMFVELEDIRPFEVLRRDREKANYLLVQEARIVAMTSTHAALRRHEIANLGFEYDSVIIEEAAQITEIEDFIPLAMQKTPTATPENAATPAKSRLKRVVLCGDHLQNSPIIQNDAVRRFANLEQSLFLRLIRLGVPHVLLDAQGRARASLAELYRWRYPALSNLPHVLTSPEFVHANAGLQYEYQFIDVPDYKGKGETEPSPHFLQNLGEAEYAVALYMYMRLLGYPARRISILTTYAGQRALIRDVLSHRCAGNRLFGLPRLVSTVDKYQGEQNDYIILSLVRTTHPGYLRSLRRLTVALSRARLGLYILGRRAVFESSPEIASAFKLLLERPAKLRLVTGEMFPITRPAEQEVQEGAFAEMEGVEHLGQYVFEMTGAKVKALKEGAETLPAVEAPADAEEIEDGPAEVEDPEEDVDGAGEEYGGV